MKRKFTLILLLGLVLAACVRTEEVNEDDKLTKTSITRSEVRSDPYDLSVTQAALNYYLSQHPDHQPIMLQPTHKYVRFLPIDTIEVDILKSIDITLFHHPLDNMDEFPEPEEPSYDTEEDTFDWMYSVVPESFTFPENIRYEIIHDLYIQHKGSAASGQQLPDNIYDSVFDKALEITGNMASTSAEANESWSPSATLSLKLNDRKQTIIPLPGVRVVARYYTNVSEATTNQQGETGPICTINTNVQYSTIWNNPYWEIRLAKSKKIRETLWAASSRAPLNDTCVYGEFEGVLAGIHRAMYAYFIEDYPLTKGLGRPSKPQHIALMHSYNSLPWQATYIPLNRNPIHIFAKSQPNSYMSPQRSMGTTFHELGHASHIAVQPGSYYTRAPSREGESWASGVEYAYMKSIVPEYKTTIYYKKYTRLTEGLMANGFTLEQVQEGFRHSGTWWEWRDRMNEMNKIDEDILSCIFYHPNDMIFDMIDVIELQAPVVCKLQPVWLSMKEDPVAHCRVIKWEVLGDQTGVTMTRHDSLKVSYLFSTPGDKTIRATVRLPEGLQKTYDKTVKVKNLDVMIQPEGEFFTFKDIPISFQPDNIVDQNTNLFGWWTNDSSGERVQISEDDRHASFRFSTPGIKTIILELDYPFITPQSVFYECNVTVKDLPAEDSFEIINAPETFLAGRQYQAKFINDNQPIYDVVKVNINHFTFLPYLRTEWSYNTFTRMLNFTIPNNYSLPVDYMLTIYYMERRYDPETKTANLVVSNYRE